ncbi:MliC family protein [Aurantimonas sp. Leaf443]|uniref:MliC family protein n=1 Tax=Aurantimonas sp. Leaf443 TaxID=1736378 RepID=UPI0006FE9D71|nr:MliC family protein [Aurantimonas sp. Leaf443]KQT85202.1 hypothetical protein ASG48_08015 [Aurantimonas sp. Leaf443]
MTRRFLLAAWLLGASSAVALAQGASGLTLELEGPAQRTRVAYACTNGPDLTVEYVNLPGNTMAILPVEGRATLFVGLLSASGAKYASGPYVWWTKGNRGDLYDERVGDPKQNVVCRVRR